MLPFVIKINLYSVTVHKILNQKDFQGLCLVINNYVQAMLMSYLTFCDMIEKMSISLFDLDLSLDWVGLCRNLPDLDCKQIPFSEFRANHGKGNHPVKMSWAPSKRPPRCSCFYRQITHPGGSQATEPPPQRSPAVFEPAIYHNSKFIKNVPSALQRTNIRKSGFWRYQNHLFLKLAALAVNIAPGPISWGKEELYIFQNKLFSFHPQETIKY